MKTLKILMVGGAPLQLQFLLIWLKGIFGKRIKISYADSYFGGFNLIHNKYKNSKFKNSFDVAIICYDLGEKKLGTELIPSLDKRKIKHRILLENIGDVINDKILEGWEGPFLVKGLEGNKFVKERFKNLLLQYLEENAVAA